MRCAATTEEEKRRECLVLQTRASELRWLLCCGPVSSNAAAATGSCGCCGCSPEHCSPQPSQTPMHTHPQYIHNTHTIHTQYTHTNTGSLVSVSKLKRHLRVCTSARIAGAQQSQPYHVAGANAGSETGEELATGSTGPLPRQQQPSDALLAAYREAAVDPFGTGMAVKRLKVASLLGRSGFEALLAKVDAAHAALTRAHPRTRSVLGGADAESHDALLQWCRVSASGVSVPCLGKGGCVE